MSTHPAIAAAQEAVAQIPIGDDRAALEAVEMIGELLHDLAAELPPPPEPTVGERVRHVGIQASATDEEIHSALQLAREALGDDAAWWMAEDDRSDRSDNCSAVFVNPGGQYQALLLLEEEGLTPFGHHRFYEGVELADPSWDGTGV